jgi:predicted CXXCH cytochrome family protein
MSQEIGVIDTKTLPFLAFLSIFGFPLILHRQAHAQTVTEHPYIAPEDIKSETCLGCHPDKKEGKFVHTAVTSGCKSCHEASSEKEKEKTTVTLMAEGSELCAMCHEVKKAPFVHGPYKAGRCLVCHNPHSSDFPRETRAATNTLCMSCHGASRPDVKVNADAKTVSLLGDRTFDLASYEKAPKIGAEHSEKSMPRGVSPSVIGKDPRKPGTELNCISCHDPHASKAEHLLHKAPESRDAAENHWLGCGPDINAQIQESVRRAGAGAVGCDAARRAGPHRFGSAESGEGMVDPLPGD